MKEHEGLWVLLCGAEGQGNDIECFNPRFGLRRVEKHSVQVGAFISFLGKVAVALILLLTGNGTVQINTTCNEWFSIG